MDSYFIALIIVVIYFFWTNRELKKELHKNKKTIDELYETVSAMKHNNETNRKRLRFYGGLILNIIDNSPIDLGYSNTDKAKICSYIREPNAAIPTLEK